jgi:two-component system LytT family response regulator
LRGIWTLLVGSDRRSQRRVRDLLRDRNGWHVAAECDGAAAAVAAVTRVVTDVAFIDVQLPDGDGFALASTLRGLDRPPLVVFTAEDQRFALDAFDAYGVGYLVKPIDKERFDTTTHRLELLLRPSAAGEAGRPSDPATVQGAPGRQLECLAIRSPGRIEFVQVDRISWVQGSGNYVEVHCDGRSFLYRERLHVLERHLDGDRFLRIHRRTIVNRSSIAEIRPISAGDYTVLMHDGASLRLSRSYRSALIALTRSP